jgi:hypothetical protein
MTYACGSLKTALMRCISFPYIIKPRQASESVEETFAFGIGFGAIVLSLFFFFFFFFLKTCLFFLIIPYYSLFILVLPAPSVGVGSALTIFRGCSTPGFFLSYISLPRYYFTMYVNSGKARYTHIKRCWDWTGLDLTFEGVWVVYSQRGVRYSVFDGLNLRYSCSFEEKRKLLDCLASSMR